MGRIDNTLYRRFVDAFDEKEAEDYRREAFGHFKELGFPHTANEAWRKTNLTKVLDHPYKINGFRQEKRSDLRSLFECDIDTLNTELFTLVNGYCSEKKTPYTDSNGLIICSLSYAREHYPELFDRHFNRYVSNKDNHMVALNTAFFSDGYFVYVPKGVEVKKTIQIVNLIESAEPLFLNTRNLIILEEQASLRLVHCDDSVKPGTSLTNTVTEVVLSAGARADYYKLQNKDEHSTVLGSTFVRQQQDSNFHSTTITLNGGFVRNDMVSVLDGRGAHADIQGLYLADKEQFVDNHVFVHHASSDCTSNQLFKGIVDEHASAVFNGHILVAQDAQRTEAFQNNNNIQLTDTASVDTHPFLEIYADDVKCSHGATVGQLDSEALFYMMQRGVCERTSRMLLMHSFAAQVLNSMKVPALKKRIEDLVTRRLKGELSACENCSLHCDDPDAVLTFEIDLSKI